MAYVASWVPVQNIDSTGVLVFVEILYIPRFKLQTRATPVPEGDHFVGVAPDWNTEGPGQAKVCQLHLASVVH